ncbi:MAG: hypothetical protein QGH45_17170 [Myxococcota bacterium]|nr:hypothetical protein [Myxococcota bacterium]
MPRYRVLNDHRRRPVLRRPTRRGIPTGRRRPLRSPDPLGGAATLPRLLDSLRLLEGQVFELVVVVAWTHGGLAEAAERWVRELLAAWRAPEGVTARLAGAALGEGIAAATGTDRGTVADLLDPTHYSGVRNRCLAAAVLLDADSLVLLDDDEALRDEDLLDALTAPLADGWDGNAGLYMEDGERVVVPVEPTAATLHFDANGPRLAAFEALLDGGRPVAAPFAFGGNLALSPRLFRHLPFDPIVPRGEDVDYVLSARLRGHCMQLDPAIRVDHFAPRKRAAPWRQLWIDGWRFLAQRRKLACAASAGGPPLDLDPYPGRVLTGDLGERLARALAALGAPPVAMARLGEWERELEGRDPWAAYGELVDVWLETTDGLRGKDADGWLPRVEGR